MVPMGLVTFLEFGCLLEVFQDGFARDDAWAVPAASAPERRVCGALVIGEQFVFER